MKLKRSLRRLAILFISLLVPVLGFTWYTGVLGDNFRVVEPGRFYRSGQMDPEDLSETLKRWGIKSVINLRGAHPDDEWYAREVEACRALGVEHVSLRFSAKKLPPPDEVLKLIDRYERGPYPMLVHCFQGADRTGLACTLWQFLVQGKPLAEAREAQLTWHYGYLGLFGTEHMGRFLDLYSGSDLPLREWVDTKYRVLYEAEKGD